jgi:hypothetical protein
MWKPAGVRPRYGNAMDDWAGQTFRFRVEQPIEDRLLNVEWITIRRSEGPEEHWPITVDQVIRHPDGTISVKAKALTADDGS